MNVERRQAAAEALTLRPSQTWAASPPVGRQSLHPPSPLIIITQLESWYSFYRPRRAEGWVNLGSWVDMYLENTREAWIIMM